MCKHHYTMMFDIKINKKREGLPSFFPNFILYISSIESHNYMVLYIGWNI